MMTSAQLCCAGCKEFITGREYTQAMEQDWHSEYFTCLNCHQNLVGNRFTLENEKPYCLDCHNQRFAKTCTTCSQSITCEQTALAYDGKHWHEFCFSCSVCENILVDEPFALKDGYLLCDRCHDERYAAQCDGCGDALRGGTMMFQYKEKQFHEECFKCIKCHAPIGSAGFVPSGGQEDAVCCMSCIEPEECAKCGEGIKSDGATYKNLPYHKQCFTCSSCSKPLAGEQFTSAGDNDDQPYCVDCYGTEVANKCARCTAPITGFEGTKYLTFQNQHWHRNCFRCIKCNTSLVGNSFRQLQQDDNNSGVVCSTCVG